LPNAGSTAAIVRSLSPRSGIEGWWCQAPQVASGRGKCANRAVEAVNQHSPGTPLLCRSRCRAPRGHVRSGLGLSRSIRRAPSPVPQDHASDRSAPTRTAAGMSWGCGDGGDPGSGGASMINGDRPPRSPNAGRKARKIGSALLPMRSGLPAAPERRKLDRQRPPSGKCRLSIEPDYPMGATRLKGWPDDSWNRRASP
jgi:hypothetical protein